MSASVSYFNVMENRLGLGPTGTHLAHGAVVGGAVWAAGQYADIAWCRIWYAPVLAGGVGALLSVAVKALLMDEEKGYDLFEKGVTRAIACNPEWSKKSFIAGDADTIARFEIAIDREVQKVLEKTPALKAPRKKGAAGG